MAWETSAKSVWTRSAGGHSTASRDGVIAGMDEPHRFIQQFADLAPFSFGRELTGFEARAVEQVFDETVEAIDGEARFFHQLRGGGGNILELFEGGLDHSQRCCAIRVKRN